MKAPATSIADAAMMTVRTIRSTSPGMFAGATSKTTTSTSSPTAPHKPSPTPPMRAPMASAPTITRNSRISLQSIQFESPSTPSGGLLGLRVCQFKDREIVAECLRQGVDRQKACAPAVPGTQNPRNCLADRVASLVYASKGEARSYRTSWQSAQGPVNRTPNLRDRIRASPPTIKPPSGYPQLLVHVVLAPASFGTSS